MSKHGDSMNGNICLKMARLQAAAHANEQDATLWRWFSDQMEDQTMSCERKKGGTRSLFAWPVASWRVTRPSTWRFAPLTSFAAH
ncbi:hypothetical protein UB46_25240 [Burkholderiaceae bacterium 16]|nr:hypothetical protein UB46_25240 [Burkholderiaceae bacterium 16]